MYFVFRRLLQMVFVLFAVTVLIFISLHLIPGDPATIVGGPQATAADLEKIRVSLGLNDPLTVQYANYMSGIFHGDLGYSFQTNQPVTSAIAIRFPNTVKLSIAALLVSLVIGIPLGLLTAVKRKSIWDTIGTTASLVGLSVPNFWLGAMLILVFAVQFPIFPVAGLTSPFWTAEGLKELVLPAISLGTAAGAIVARMTRSSMLEILNSDFIRTVRAKGVRESQVIGIHALRNALIPVITVVGVNFGVLLGGALVTEQVFAINGIGRLIVDALNARDFPIVQGAVLLVAAVFVIVNFFVDVLYAVVDPRVNVS